jgi:microcystin-dependent protein
MATVPMLSTIADQAASQIAGAVSSLMPSGVVLPFGGTTAPTGWLLCDGSPISRTTYSALFSAIGTTHGTGDGVNTFNLPDMRGVFPRGAGTNGTSNYGGVTGHTPAGGTVATKGGQKTAKNGLSNGSSTVTTTFNNSNISHTHSADHDHGATSSGPNGDHTHYISAPPGYTNPNQYLTWNAGPGVWAGPELSTNNSALDNANRVITDAPGNHNHSTDLASLAVTTGSGGSTTFQPSVNSNTAAAQTISSADTETTPASLTLHYIIKI